MTISLMHMTIRQINENSSLGLKCLAEQKKSKEISRTAREMITLLDYALADRSAQQSLEKEFDLKNRFDVIESIISFKERVNNTALAVLESVKLYYFQKEGEYKVKLERTGVWVALIDSSTFCEIGVDQLKEYWLAENVIATRLDVLSKTEPDLCNQYAQRDKNFLSFLSKVFLNIEFPIGQIMHLTGAELSGIASKLDKHAFSLVSDEVMVSLDFAKLSGDKINAAISGNGSDETWQRRVRKLTPEQIKHTFLKSSSSYPKMPSELFQSCPLSQMERENISFLFNHEDGKSRFQKVAVNEIMNAIDKIDNSLFFNLSIDQIRALDLSRINSEKFGYIFDYLRDSDEMKKEKVRAIPLAQVRANGSRLNGNQLKMLSMEQIQVLDFSQLKRDQIESLLSDELIRSLDAPRLNQVMRYISSTKIGLIQPEILTRVDISLLNDQQISALFPPFTCERLYPGLAHRPQGGSHIFEARSQKGYTFMSFEQKEIDRMTAQNERTCRQNLAYITPEQFEWLRSKLPPEVVALYGNI